MRMSRAWKASPFSSVQGGSVVNATTTGSDGSYTFKNLASGSYTVSEVAQRGLAADPAQRGHLRRGADGWRRDGQGLRQPRQPVHHRHEVSTMSTATEFRTRMSLGFPEEVTLVENGQGIAKLPRPGRILHLRQPCPGTYRWSDPPGPDG